MELKEEVIRQLTRMEKEEEKDIGPSLNSPNPIYSSPVIKRRRSKLKIKKRLVPKMPMAMNTKSEAKQQLVSDNSGKSVSCRRKRITIDDLYDNAEAKFSVMERAEVTMANLATEFPSFVKCMLPSNVSHGFWMFLPQKFCKLHLPRHDTTVVLVDECGEEYKTNYLVGRHGLSAGWRRFSIDHKLLKGDRLVFYLVGPCKLKVNIVRVYGLEEVDAALCLLNIVACAKRTDSREDTTTRKKAKRCVEHFLLDKPQEDIHIKSENSKLALQPIRSENNSDDFGSEVLEGSEDSDHLQANDLCCSQNSFQNNQRVKGINHRFATGKVS